MPALGPLSMGSVMVFFPAQIDCLLCLPLLTRMAGCCNAKTGLCHRLRPPRGRQGRRVPRRLQFHGHPGETTASSQTTPSSLLILVLRACRALPTQATSTWTGTRPPRTSARCPPLPSPLSTVLALPTPILSDRENRPLLIAGHLQTVIAAATSGPSDGRQTPPPPRGSDQWTPQL